MPRPPWPTWWGAETEAGRLVAADPWPPVEDRDLAARPPEERADVEAARKRVVAAEAARDLAKAQKSGGTSRWACKSNTTCRPTNSYGFGVSVPLFIWHEYEGEIGRAEADLDAAGGCMPVPWPRRWATCRRQKAPCRPPGAAPPAGNRTPSPMPRKWPGRRNSPTPKAPWG